MHLPVAARLSFAAAVAWFATGALAVACHASPDASAPNAAQVTIGSASGAPPLILSTTASPPVAPPAPPLPDDVVAALAFFDDLPTCPSGMKSVDADTALTPPASNARKAMRGSLTLGSPICTSLACDTECCNHCGLSWTLRSRSAERRATIQLANGKELFAGVMDCHMRSLAMRAATLGEVVVTGQLIADPNGQHDFRIVGAELCAIRPPGS